MEPKDRPQTRKSLGFGASPEPVDKRAPIDARPILIPTKEKPFLVRLTDRWKLYAALLAILAAGATAGAWASGLARQGEVTALEGELREVHQAVLDHDQWAHQERQLMLDRISAEESKNAALLGVLTDIRVQVADIHGRVVGRGK